MNFKACFQNVIMISFVDEKSLGTQCLLEETSDKILGRNDLKIKVIKRCVLELWVGIIM